MESLAEDSDGSLWLNTYYDGVVHVKSNAKDLFSINNNTQV